MAGKDTMRILFLLPTYTFGGAERTSLNLLGGIDKKKFRICLVTSKKIFTYFRHIDIEKFIPLEDIGIDTWFTTCTRFFHDVRRVAALLKKENPHLAFGMMHYPSSLLVFAKKIYRSGIKVIVSPRGPSTEYLRHFEPRGIRCISLRTIFRIFLRFADGIIVNSSGMMEECIRDFNAVKKNIAVIHNGVDVKRIRELSREDAGIEMKKDITVFSAAGRLSKEKNFPFLIKTFSLVRKEREALLLLIGDGFEKNFLQTLSADLGVKNDVLFLGYQNNPYKYIRRSNIFVHTCLFEGFPNIILEAMAIGVPVVSIDCPYGPRDIMKDGESGFLIPVNDEEAMAHALLKLAKDREIRERIGAKGAERAAMLTVQKMVAGYEAFFCTMADTP
jgi:glycosyltransferase involved in cell wall biosynthesis